MDDGIGIGPVFAFECEEWVLERLGVIEDGRRGTIKGVGERTVEPNPIGAVVRLDDPIVDLADGSALDGDRRPERGAFVATAARVSSPRSTPDRRDVAVVLAGDIVLVLATAGRIARRPDGTRGRGRGRAGGSTHRSALRRVRDLLKEHAFLDIIEQSRHSGGSAEGSYTEHQLLEDPDVVKKVLAETVDP